MQNGGGANVCKLFKPGMLAAFKKETISRLSDNSLCLPYCKTCFCEMCISGSFVHLLQVALLRAVLKQATGKRFH